ncbi:B3 domain-containing protein [Cucumis melo var. makuwa]|uniref:B3 domain-containing protein n=4 Tax=Cucumis melo TaxID=3656 RepID=A0A5A7SSE3_CUCMM|nr:B3 domain-containing protein At2g31420-like [Cucumis melo]KAA0032105.1 B3 domain-containing protein [Cucumis melo var. makuwa]
MEMDSNTSSPSANAQQEQETTVSTNGEITDQNPSDDDDHLPLIKRKRTRMKQLARRHKRDREKILKRPLKHPVNDPIPKSDEEPQGKDLVFDTETESEGDADQNQETLTFMALAEIVESEREFLENIPEEYKKLMIFMGGSWDVCPSLVMEKRLKKGDVEERRNRLLIPQRKTRTTFLEVEEEEKLNTDVWWMVEIIEPDCTVSLITLSKWETRKGVAYVLITEWNGLVERNDLKEGDLMQLWSFRAGGGRGRLCFMLLEVEENRERR